MAVNQAYSKKNRTNKGTPIDANAAASYQANSYSGGHKILAVGPEFLKQGTNAYVSGRDVSAGDVVTPGSILYIFNSTNQVHWVALSTATIASQPTGITDGIPLSPNAWTILSAGENSFIRTDNSNIGLYDVKDDTNLIDQA